MKPNTIKILHIDSNHPLLWNQLEEAGFENHADFKSSKEEITLQISNRGHFIHVQESFHTQSPSEFYVEAIEPTIITKNKMAITNVEITIPTTVAKTYLKNSFM